MKKLGGLAEGSAIKARRMKLMGYACRASDQLNNRLLFLGLRHMGAQQCVHYKANIKFVMGSSNF